MHHFDTRRSRGRAGGPSDPNRRETLFGLLTGAAMLGCVPAWAQTGPLAREPSRAPADLLDSYRLGPGDELRVIVLGEPDLSSAYVIAANGKVAVPLAGEVEAGGKTAAGFSDALREKLAQFIRKPEVAVEITRYRPFYIFGEVQRPGAYPYAAGLTVEAAVALAGGFTYRANKRRFFLKREDWAAESSVSFKTAEPLSPGDRVRIGERFF